MKEIIAGLLSEDEVVNEILEINACDEGYSNVTFYLREEDAIKIINHLKEKFGI